MSDDSLKGSVAILKQRVADLVNDNARLHAEKMQLLSVRDAITLQLRAAEQAREAAEQAIDAFLAKWPSVDKVISGMFSLQWARTGHQYSGPTIGPEIDGLKAVAAARATGGSERT